MNNTLLSLLSVLCLIFVSCTPIQQNNNGLPEPKIEPGIAKLSGRIIYRGEKPKKMFPAIFIMKLNLLMDDVDVLEIPVDEEGSFAYEIFIPISPDFAGISMDRVYASFLLNLVPDQETNLEIICHESDSIEAKIISGPDFFFIDSEEEGHVFRLFSEMAMLGSDKSRTNKDTINLFVQNPNEYIPYFIRNNLNPRLDIMKKDTVLSDNIKAYYSDIFSLFMFKFTFFELSFSEAIIRIYEDIKPEGDTTTLKILNDPDKSYYSFLKDLNLNNPQYLYNMHYSTTCQKILTNKTLNLNSIDETPIDEWLHGVKATMADLVGFDKGQFYDILTANAYSKQFIDELKPLSDIQIKNIKEYFKGGGIEKMLLHENEKIVKLAKDKGETIVNETPSVPNEELLDNIISKYRGKAIVVDFWATWCAPCLSAMKEIQPLKSELKDKDIVFVYITNTSSPKELWEAKIKGIDGEHYYLNEDQWLYIMNSMKITAIPAYLFYNKTGEATFDPVRGYPGKDWMRSLIKNAMSK